MVMIIEGLPYFAFPEKMKNWVVKIIEMHENALRIMGLLLMVTGIFLIFLGRR
jgi:uncharacterized protein YjeT (DUF2065 family)